MTDWPWWRLAVVVMVVNSEGAYDGWLDWMGGFLLAVHLCAPFYVSHRSALPAAIGQHINTLAITPPAHSCPDAQRGCTATHWQHAQHDLNPSCARDLCGSIAVAQLVRADGAQVVLLGDDAGGLGALIIIVGVVVVFAGVGVLPAFIWSCLMASVLANMHVGLRATTRLAWPTHSWHCRQWFMGRRAATRLAATPASERLVHASAHPYTPSNNNAIWPNASRQNKLALIMTGGALDQTTMTC